MRLDVERLERWADRRDCPLCKVTFEDGWFLPADRPTINGAILFHLHDTHGLDRELMVPLIVGHMYQLDPRESLRVFA